MASAVFFLDLKGKVRNKPSQSLRRIQGIEQKKKKKSNMLYADPPSPKLQRRYPHVRRRKVPHSSFRSRRGIFRRTTLFFRRRHKCVCYLEYFRN